ncbi:hypothetical protein GCM10009798_12380 [Nocardioides panacihumi]|uniref:DUF4229 domain-containing protein n=1 Tax=Nocardioides panacihumi TaxID=400774 RepID=A0ABP5BYC5_9ACTN
MKEFVVYTLMRLALLVATFAVIAGIWMLVGEGLTATSVFVVLLISFVVSGVASYFLLNGQRVAFASKVERRADATMERMRTKEDQD